MTRIPTDAALVAEDLAAVSLSYAAGLPGLKDLDAARCLASGAFPVEIDRHQSPLRRLSPAVSA